LVAIRGCLIIDPHDSLGIFWQATVPQKTMLDTWDDYQAERDQADLAGRVKNKKKRTQPCLSFGACSLNYVVPLKDLLALLLLASIVMFSGKKTCD